MLTYRTANKKCGKFPANLLEEVTWKKLCVDIIGLLKIRRKVKEPLILKFVSTIDPVIGWFEITYCNDNKSSMIAIKVETMWLDRYPYPIDVTYDQGVELLGCEFKNTLI